VVALGKSKATNLPLYILGQDNPHTRESSCSRATRSQGRWPSYWPAALPPGIKVVYTDQHSILLGCILLLSEIWKLVSTPHPSIQNITRIFVLFYTGWMGTCFAIFQIYNTLVWKNASISYLKSYYLQQ
jgi:hypothetical protein